MEVFDTSLMMDLHVHRMNALCGEQIHQLPLEFRPFLDFRIIRWEIIIEREVDNFGLEPFKKWPDGFRFGQSIEGAEGKDGSKEDIATETVHDALRNQNRCVAPSHDPRRTVTAEAAAIVIRCIP